MPLFEYACLMHHILLMNDFFLQYTFTSTCKMYLNFFLRWLGLGQSLEYTV